MQLNFEGTRDDKIYAAYLTRAEFEMSREAVELCMQDARRAKDNWDQYLDMRKTIVAPPKPCRWRLHEVQAFGRMLQRAMDKSPAGELYFEISQFANREFHKFGLDKKYKLR